jgi:hypothetical protein
MTLCIKNNIFNIKNILLGKEKNIEEEDGTKKTIIRPILYKYDCNITEKFCFVTDWVHVTKFSKYNTYIIFHIDDDNIKNIVNAIKNKIKFDSDNIYINDDENINNIHETDNNIFFRFKNTSQITLYPSKKSGLPIYELNKIENINEIKRYFPSFNRQGECKIYGKFLVTINCSLTKIDNFTHTNIIYSIKTGELKYEKSYIKDNKIKTKSIFEDKIKIEI